MLSDVVLVGVAKENMKRGFRRFDVESTDALTEKKIHSNILICYWTRDANSRITRIKMNTPVVIRGRIENDDEYGLIIVAESIYLCS